MITKTLKIGDYIFTAQGYLARITKINKQTYSYASINRGYGGNIGLNGIRNSRYGNEEWFECNDVQAKAFELAIKHYEVSSKRQDDLRELKELIGKAKFFLNQIEDLEEIDVEEAR